MLLDQYRTHTRGGSPRNGEPTITTPDLLSPEIHYLYLACSATGLDKMITMAVLEGVSEPDTRDSY